MGRRRLGDGGHVLPRLSIPHRRAGLSCAFLKYKLGVKNELEDGPENTHHQYGGNRGVGFGGLRFQIVLLMIYDVYLTTQARKFSSACKLGKTTRHTDTESGEGY